MQKKNISILVIEDSIDDLELYSRLLSKIFNNPNIGECLSADEGREAIKDNNYDLILLDYNLPGINGLDFVKSINQMDLELVPPIIALTGQGNEKIAVEFMRLGVCDYILKSDISKESLSFAINKALESSYNAKIEHEKRLEQARFAHTVAHDLRAPLGRIAAYSKMIQSKEQGSPICKYVQNIKEDSKYMIDFLDNLLAYAEAGRSGATKDKVDLNDIVQQSMHNLEIEIKSRDAAVSFEELPQIYGNSISLVQLFQNIISNALKYTKEKPVIEVTSEVNNDSAIITVKDNGIGIDPEQSGAILEPFTRLSNDLDASGLGLGLALCKTIIKQHMADIKICPSSKGGTEVSLIFPKIASEVPA